jgi:phospholipase C
LRHHKKLLASGGAVAVAAGAILIGLTGSSADPGTLPPPTTPIQHVVVIFDENVSFDHYFGTYPNATNPPGESQFTALPGTPTVNGLTPGLLTNNPNLNNPQRLDPDQALTCSQNHSYSPEQQADDMGLMDMFVQKTTGGGCTQGTTLNKSSYGPNGIVMDYYDGNTVTAMWNLAQHYSLSDNFYDSQFGPSTPGALNLISGQTNGTVLEPAGATSSSVANGTTIGDTEPFFDLCSNNTTADTADPGNANQPDPGGTTAQLTGKNIGDLMNSAGMTWGWFQGGFTPGATVPAGATTDPLSDAGSTVNYNEGPLARPACNTSHTNIGGASVQDYVEHHEPFEYYASTANPMHNAPAAVSDVGVSDPANTPIDSAVNHQYDMSWFSQALNAGNLPQVSFLKPPAYENAHPGNSDPLDEQKFVVDTVNQIEQSSYWPNTAIIIAYDDSDGWYDHQLGPIVRQSQDTADALSGAGKCGSGATPPAQNDRCGVGPRLPMLVISPWARQNSVDSTFTEQASITKFIEQNWGLGSISGGSADATAGSIDGMFDFNANDQRAPEVLMNDQSGEVTSVTPAPPPTGGGTQGPPGPQGPAGPGGPAGTNGANGANGTNGANGANGAAGPAGPAGPQGPAGRTPTIKCVISGKSPHITVTCNATGASKDVRARVRNARIAVMLHHNGRLAAIARGRLGKRITVRAKLHGSYTLAVDIGGRVQIVRKVHLG